LFPAIEFFGGSWMRHRGSIVDYRPGAGIRVAPHFYTSDSEVEAVVAHIDDILAKDAWMRYTDDKLVVT